MNRKKGALSFIEATLLITGAGLGTGILAIPYLVIKMGLVQAVTALLLACGVSIISHLMIADMAIHSKDSDQILGMFEQHLFPGGREQKGAKLFFAAFFGLLFIMLLLNLALYITCTAEIMASTFGMNYHIAEIFFYILASALVVFGVKSIGISEKLSMGLIAVVVIVLGVLSLPHREGGLEFSGGAPLVFVSLYSMCMFSFSAVFSVPQVVNYIADKTKIRRCVILGIACNAAITLVFSLITAYSCAEVTKVATVGLSATFGSGAKILSAVFVALAMLTSYLSIALAQIEVVREHTKWKRTPVWLISTIPTIVIAGILPLSYHSYIELVGGVFAIIVAGMVLPSYYRSVRGGNGLLLGDRVGKSVAPVVVILIFYLLMATGALIPIS
jgi:amino acid permease